MFIYVICGCLRIVVSNTHCNVNAYNRISFLRDKILALINVRPMHDLELGVPLNRLH
jgi:hypothetical protein